MIQGDKVCLRAPEERDLETLRDLRNDFALQGTLMARPRANGMARVRRWIEDRLADPDAVFFVIARRQDDAALGFVQVLAMDLVSGVGELGICCAEAARGQGHGGEALRLLEDYLTGIFNLRKLVLKVLAQNSGAVRFYERLGFDTVGTHRRHFFRDGAYHDVTVMEKFLEARP